MLTSRKNQSVKALQSRMASEKKRSARSLMEWELACNTNVNRGKVYSQEEVCSLYNRRGQSRGASKAVHTINHEGNDFKYIVIKRHREYGYIPDANHEHSKCTGNQLIDEVNCWLEYQEQAEADLLCPILKYFTSKSDKVTATSDKMQYNVVIIAQKAINGTIGDASYACRKAEELNRQHGFHGEDRYDRFDKLKALSKARGWRDAMHNGGNSGVIFDYAQGCYKAVFIDYAL